MLQASPIGDYANYDDDDVHYTIIVILLCEVNKCKQLSDFVHCYNYDKHYSICIYVICVK